MIIAISSILVGIILGYIFIKKSNYLFTKDKIVKDEKIDINSDTFKMVFNILEPDIYSISFIGCKAVDINESVFILENGGNKIELKKTLKYVFTYKGRAGVEIYSFKAIDIGEYNLFIKNIQNVKCYSSNLRSARFIMGSSTVEGKELLIKKFMNSFNKILLIVIAVLSLMFISFGAITIFSNH